MSDSVIGAVVGVLNSAPFAGSIPGKCWACEIPEHNSEYPVQALYWSNTDFIWTHVQTHIENIRLRLETYALTAEAAERLGRRSYTLLLSEKLDDIGGTSMQLFPIDFYVQASKHRGTDGVRLYESVAIIRADMNRTRG